MIGEGRGFPREVAEWFCCGRWSHHLKLRTHSDVISMHVFVENEWWVLSLPYEYVWHVRTFPCLCDCSMILLILYDFMMLAVFVDLPCLFFVCIGHHRYHHQHPHHHPLNHRGETLRPASARGHVVWGSQLLPLYPQDVQEVLLMEEIMHHLTRMKPCKQWDIINWCKISSINSMSVSKYLCRFISVSTKHFWCSLIFLSWRASTNLCTNALCMCAWVYPFVEYY